MSYLFAFSYCSRVYPGKNTTVGCHFLLCFCCCITSVMSDSVRPHRQQPTRLRHPWDSPGKNAGVGCHFLLQCMKVKSESKVTQSCRTLPTPWTAAYQAPPFMGFSRQEYWSGLPLPSPISSSSGPHFVRTLHYHLSILGDPA